MHKVILILDKFFLKYEGRSIWAPPEKTTLKKPSLIRVNAFVLDYFFLRLLHIHDLVKLSSTLGISYTYHRKKYWFILNQFTRLTKVFQFQRLFSIIVMSLMKKAKIITNYGILLLQPKDIWYNLASIVIISVYSEYNFFKSGKIVR